MQKKPQPVKKVFWCSYKHCSFVLFSYCEEKWKDFVILQTYPPPVPPFLLKCVRGSLDASLSSSFHSRSHSSSVYTKPDYGRERTPFYCYAGTKYKQNSVVAFATNFFKLYTGYNLLSWVINCSTILFRQKEH